MQRYLWPLALLVALAGVLLAPAAGQAGAPPNIAWTPSTNGNFSYGTVTFGQSVPHQFTLTNSGGSASAALTIALSGSTAFTKTSDGCTAHSIGPRKTCKVTVRYSPSAAGARDSATLTASGKKPAASASVTLTGEGLVVSHLYWTNFGEFPDANQGTITMAGLDGSNPQTIVSGQGVPAGIAVDASHLYWANEFDGTIHMAGLDGSNPQTIATGQSQSTGVAVDASHLYWANFTGGTITMAGLDGSNPQTIATGQSEPIGVAVDANHLYWANFGDGTIAMAGLGGSNSQTIVSGLSFPQALALDASHLYWVSGDSIHAAGLDGSNPQTIVGSVDVLGPALAVDASHLYWTGYFEGTIHMAGLDGSNPQTIASGQNFPGGVAVGPG